MKKNEPMHKQLAQLKEFHDKTDHEWRTDPTIDIPDNIKDRRVRIMLEEFNELIAAIYRNEPIEDLAKELADVVYTTFGTVGAFGLADKFDAVFDAVHKSNMSKIPVDGVIKFNEHGKVIKPPGYKKPDIKKILESNS
ncbi:hypothetical protein C5B42_01980 [Candidatus Cerribacteria bacterium 'Amazon FNV 2010 28 9']|uniref:Phosphoribosyl-ATP diphosphatase n=1 Tax=Candidatus Cerribacteria bacterium 'Amazon FNV 2010 28 9' TaxID=2081795 RepID=A0A317JTG1_9BACT|nr:MAG: hypothetical protein C5B42_01980 [Candidatus Cerribacteria bacterium 'Amazon FNV 2010 28 9']